MRFATAETFFNVSSGKNDLMTEIYLPDYSWIKRIIGLYKAGRIDRDKLAEMWYIMQLPSRILIIENMGEESVEIEKKLYQDVWHSWHKIN